MFFVTDTTPLIAQQYPPPPFGEYIYINHIVPAAFIDSMWVDSCLNTTSINEANYHSDNFLLYPNPTVNKLTISSQQFANKRVTVTMCDLIGMQKLQTKFVGSADGKIVIDVHNLASGIYFVKVNNSVQRFVKM